MEHKEKVGEKAEDASLRGARFSCRPLEGNLWIKACDLSLKGQSCMAGESKLEGDDVLVRRKIQRLLQ